MDKFEILEVLQEMDLEVTEIEFSSYGLLLSFKLEGNLKLEINQDFKNGKIIRKDIDEDFSTIVWPKELRSKYGQHLFDIEKLRSVLNYIKITS